MMSSPSGRKEIISAVLLAVLIPLLLFWNMPRQPHLSSSMAVAAEFSDEAEKVCVVMDPALPEASGIAMSRRQDNSIWIHNDSGDSARLFLVGLDGRTRAIVSARDIQPMDWEDMCSFELDGEKWLLVGDIGDNGRVRGKSAPVCRLLLFREPELTSSTATPEEPPQQLIEVVSVTEFSFPDGPQDCESLAVDTKRREILLLTKTEPLNCRLFRLPLRLGPGPQQTPAEPVASLGVPWATAMDISPDGLRMVVVNMFSGALIERTATESWSEACQRPVTVLTLPPRRQGEAVCFECGGQSVLLNSEGLEQPLWRIRLPKRL